MKNYICDKCKKMVQFGSKYTGPVICVNCKITMRTINAKKESTADTPINGEVMPPQLAEVMKIFPLQGPDRVVEGPNGEWLAAWQMADNYFEIECTPEGKLEIMTRFDGEFKHWDLVQAT